MFSLTFDTDLTFQSGFRPDGSPHPCSVVDCGGALEPLMDGERGLCWSCAKCGGWFVSKASTEAEPDDEDATASNVARLDGEGLRPLTAQARVHLDASVTLSVGFERATPKALKLVHSLLFWAERNAKTRSGYLQGARFGWQFVKVGDVWTVTTSRGHPKAALVATKLMKPRTCASCRATIVKGERCYAEGKTSFYKQHQNARWCVTCVERTAREELPENVVRLNARRKAPR